jgi:RNA polymerase sigma-70 factor (ECF subfamily)
LELLAGVGRHEVGALGELYDRLAPRAFGLLTHILSSQKEAEAILQQIFMRLWNEGGSLGVEGGSVAAWLIMTSRDAALERLRESRQDGLAPGPPPDGAPRLKRVAIDSRKSKLPRSTPAPLKAASKISDARHEAARPAPAGFTVRVLNPWLPRPGDIALIEDRLDLLHKVIHQLPESQRRALDLALFRGFSELEIAGELGEPLGKVRTGLRAAVTFVKHRRLAILGKWAANI